MKKSEGHSGAELLNYLQDNENITIATQICI